MNKGATRAPLLPIILFESGEPSRARTCDPLIKSAFRDTPAGYRSYDLSTFVTGCSRQRVYLLLLVKTSLPLVLSQVCLKLFVEVAVLTEGRI